VKSDFLLPKENIIDETMTVVHWYAKDRDFVEKDQEFVEVETSKTVLNLISEESGYIFRRALEGETVSVGSVLASFYSDLAELDADIEKAGDDGQIKLNLQKRSEEKEPISTGAENPSSAVSTPTHFSKDARKYINKNNIDPNLFNGYGLVTVQVIKKILGKYNPKQEQKYIASKKDTETVTGASDLRSEEISASKRLEINLLTAGSSGKINSSLTVQFKSEKIRQILNELGTINGQIFTLILFELSKLLEEFPKFTAYYENGRVYYYDRVNIGIAMDMEKGLKVVVIKDVNHLSNTQLADQLTRNGINYLEDKLTIDDLSSGTITITDLSNDGILHFQPLINKKQSVILGIGGDGNLDGYPMTLTMVFDHRVLTGREVSIFLNKLKNRLLSYELETSEQ
jgi:2-oxoglutarate dehydrogenase E2 component (dihydrolipoamide succinyltransferase)|tara:strand:- start:2067 stop:3266 length:1200 start_codon:yes stop_codon:yes gene_type:complete